MKILLDTSFLLPTVGIKVDSTRIPRVIEHLLVNKAHFSIHYTEISVLETTWVFLRTRRMTAESDSSITVFEKGLESISKQYTKLDIPLTAFVDSVRLKEKGHPDLIDCLLYETAKSWKIPFLTMDKRLIAFIEEIGERTEFLMSDREILKLE